MEVGPWTKVDQLKYGQLVDKKNIFVLKFLSTRCATLLDETCGSRFQG